MNLDIEKEIENAADYLKYKIPKGTYMVTGATGIIANYIVKILLKLDGIKVIALCHTYQKGVDIFAEYMNHHLIIAEKEITIPMNDIYGNIDYIIHTAAICQNKICQEYPQEVINVNVVGTYQLLEYAKKKNIKKFCFFSSAAVYGKVSSELYKEDAYGKIDFTNPNNAYGLSKCVGENLCTAYESLFPIMIVRPFHIIEPLTLLAKDSMLGEFYDRIRHEQPIILKTDGTPKRNFTWIIDAVRVILELMQQGAGVYNIGNPNGTISVKEIAEIIMNITGKRSILKYNHIKSKKPSNELNMVPDLEKQQDIIQNKHFLDIQEAMRISIKGR